jgi:ABC-2 type transport system permease protein
MSGPTQLRPASLGALFSVEVRRILARRAVRFVGALALFGILTGATVTFIRSHRLDAVDRARIAQETKSQARAAFESCVNGGVPPEEVSPDLTLEEFCHRLTNFGLVPADLGLGYQAIDIRNALLGVNAVVMAILLGLGATIVGAEWHAGTMTTLLTWEPRRVRVQLMKVAATVLFAFLASVLVQAVLAAALLPSAALRGTFAGAGGAWLRTTVAVAFRGAAIASIAAAMGFALASIARNTAAALGIGLGYFAVVEPILRGLRPRWQPWFLFDNAATFIQGHSPLFAEHPRSALGAGLVLLAYAAVAVAAAAALFRRRDVA